MKNKTETTQGTFFFENTFDMIMFMFGILYMVSFVCTVYCLIKNRDLLAMMAQPMPSSGYGNDLPRLQDEDGRIDRQPPVEMELKDDIFSINSLKSISSSNNSDENKGGDTSTMTRDVG